MDTFFNILMFVATFSIGDVFGFCWFIAKSVRPSIKFVLRLLVIIVLIASTVLAYKCGLIWMWGIAPGCFGSCLIMSLCASAGAADDYANTILNKGEELNRVE